MSQYGLAPLPQIFNVKRLKTHVFGLFTSLQWYSPLSYTRLCDLDDVGNSLYHDLPDLILI